MELLCEPKTQLGWSHWYDESTPVRLGASSCLLGEMVRYDGGHCRDEFVTEMLGPLVQWVSICPEMGIGMGTPRPTIRLSEDSGQVRLVESRSGVDHTEAMESYTRKKLEQVGPAQLDGYVVKKNSPTCGLQRIAVYKGEMKSHKRGVGLFTNILCSDYPDLPVEEDGRLNDARLRESFVEQIFCRNRWRRLVDSGLTRGKLVEFHTAHKLQLRAHDERAYRKLGLLVGSAGTFPDQELFDSYGREFLKCIAIPASTGRHINVMHHAMGYFKEVLPSAVKHHLLDTIEEYRSGHLPLIVPLSLLAFNAHQHQIDYLLGQVYFDPYPREWMLRNHA
ncbi:MAG: DUF523 and DUF1722 domain-containing protein [Planctomycetota bacterium]|nr:DUF523 and DUF1722 domain-containing protein [Planctomycetota bacterium]